jgi:phosphate-selective porin OprO/OprP
MILPRGAGVLILAVGLACLPPAPLAAQVRIPISLLTSAAPADDSSTAAASPSDSPAAGQSAQEDKDQEKSTRRVRFIFRNRPSLRFGRMLRVDFRVKIQTDYRMFDPEIPAEDGRLFELHRARFYLEGNFLRHFEYQIERDSKEEVSRGEFTTKHPWKDIYVNFRYFRGFQIQGGRFKIPFGMEQNIGTFHLDFVRRSLMSDYLTPARDLGIMVHGRFFERALNYELGLFAQDGDNSEIKVERAVNGTNVLDETFPSGQRTFVGRVAGNPLRLLPLPATLRGISLGFGFADSALPPSLGGLRGRTYADRTFFAYTGDNQHMAAHGHRRRYGGEAAWMPGPFSLKGEFVAVQDQRLGQALSGADLPNLISRGWYLSGTWLVTGEKKSESFEPKHPFLLSKGIGAVELGARWEALRFGSAEHIARPSRSLRAANILGNSDRAWTFGVNWYWNRFVKVQFNAMREQVEDIQRSPFGTIEPFWMRIVRVQFVL